MATRCAARLGVLPTPRALARSGNVSLITVMSPSSRVEPIGHHVGLCVRAELLEASGRKSPISFEVHGT